jgi:hypothetical protein
MASKSPTKERIIPKSQAIEDSNYDGKNGYHLVKVHENK